MENKEEQHFRISAELKNIIGKDLINDDSVAIFELVKNSYDAYAKRVDVYFENLNTKNSKIVIEDNGKGMNFTDLKNKWLFLAYSAKKEGTEDLETNYRNKIKRDYAGVKGVGRFSCDRLGSNLYLETKKEENNAKTESLTVDWKNFEDNIRKEFEEVPLYSKSILDGKSKIKEHGTILEITNLRSEWDRIKLLKLKDDLTKLINPNPQNIEDDFKIFLHVNSEKDIDKKTSDHRKKVNGEIKNDIFDTLSIKTTKITSEISSKNLSLITTSLQEGGKLVYKISEKNKFTNLCSIRLTIYYLNRNAKESFKKKMGIPPVDYGHIFVYKNGLRIYPYGERGEDPLKMDNRKTQGTRRYLGTREVIGFIEILNNENELNETTSRSDGLTKNETYFSLIEWFYETLKRLEKYILDVTSWGNDLSKDSFINLENSKNSENIKKIIQNLIKSDSIVNAEFNENIFNLLDEKQKNSITSLLYNIKKDIYSDNFDKTKTIEKLNKFEKKIEDLKKIKEEAEDEAIDKLIENESLVNKNNIITKILEKETKEKVFFRSLTTNDKEKILSLQHEIAHASSRVKRNLELLVKELGLNNINKKITKYISVISLEASKVESISKIITKANFNLKANKINDDLVKFIINYINEFYLHDEALLKTELLNINFINTNKIGFSIYFIPLEITTLIDNFIQNSEKANSKNLNFKFSKIKNNLLIEIFDDGFGIENDIIDRIFDLGFTTTDGSGIGLYNIKKIVEDLKGTINVDSKINSGAKFDIFIEGE